MYESYLPKPAAKFLKALFGFVVVIYLVSFAWFFLVGPYDFIVAGQRIYMDSVEKPLQIFIFALVLLALVSDSFYGVVKSVYIKLREKLTGGAVEAPAPNAKLDYGVIPALFFLLTLIFTWPIASGIATWLDNSGDPALNAWILWRMNENLLTASLGMMEGNIFFPYENVMAYSETMLAGALLVMPVHLFGGSPVAEYNTLLLAAFTLNGYGMYLLGKEITGSRAAGFIAGLVFAFSMPRYNHLQQIQMVCSHWMPFALLFWLKYIRRPNFKTAALFTLFTSLTILSNLHFAVYLAFALVVWGVYELFLGRISLKMILTLAGLMALAGAAMSPMLLPYIGNPPRQLSDVSIYSNSSNAFFSPYGYNWIYGRWSFITSGGDWFPGATALLLAAAGLISLAPGKAAGRSPVIIIAIIGFLSAWASLGPAYWLYEYLYENFPGISGIRATERIAILYLIAIAVLAAQGFAFLSGLAKKGAIFTTALFIALILAESVSIHGKWFAHDEARYERFAWLAQRDDVKNLLYFPIRVEPVQITYASRYHRKKTVNGYSGYFPPVFKWFQDNQAWFPSREQVSILQALEVDHILIDRCCVDDGMIEKAAVFEDLSIAGEKNGLTLLKIKQKRIDHDKKALLAGDMKQFFSLDDVKVSARFSSKPEMTDGLAVFSVAVRNEGEANLPPDTIKLNTGFIRAGVFSSDHKVSIPSLPPGRETGFNFAMLPPKQGETAIEARLVIDGKILASTQKTFIAGRSEEAKIIAATSNVNHDDLKYTFDGKTGERWSTRGKMEPGYFIAFELEKTTEISRITLLNTAPYYGAHPKSLNIYVSENGEEWKLARTFNSFVTRDVANVELLTLDLPKSKAKHVKIEPIEVSPQVWWSIFEARIE